MDLSDSIDGMMRALDDEIAESRKEPADLIHLSDGTRQAHPTGPRAVYRFSAERTRPLRRGVHGLLILPDGTDIPASVVDGDLGTRVPEAALGLRNDQLLGWLRERLRNHSRTVRIGSRLCFSPARRTSRSIGCCFRLSIDIHSETTWSRARSFESERSLYRRPHPSMNATTDR